MFSSPPPSASLGLELCRGLGVIFLAEQAQLLRIGHGLRAQVVDRAFLFGPRILLEAQHQRARVRVLGHLAAPAGIQHNDHAEARVVQERHAGTAPELIQRAVYDDARHPGPEILRILERSQVQQRLVGGVPDYIERILLVFDVGVSYAVVPCLIRLRLWANSNLSML